MRRCTLCKSLAKPCICDRLTTFFGVKKPKVDPPADMKQRVYLSVAALRPDNATICFDYGFFHYRGDKRLGNA